jgi:hypothetical protein
MRDPGKRMLHASRAFLLLLNWVQVIAGFRPFVLALAWQMGLPFLGRPPQHCRHGRKTVLNMLRTPSLKGVCFTNGKERISKDMVLSRQ